MKIQLFTALNIKILWVMFYFQPKVTSMFPAKNTIDCPVCSNKEFDVTFMPWVDEQDPHKLYGISTGIQGTQRLVTCRGCGLLYENPRYSAQTIIDGYASADDPTHDSQYQARVGSFLKALRKLSAYIPAPGAKVLDVGSAEGAFLEAATAYGYDVCGLEPSHFRVQKGKERGLQIIEGVIETNQFEPASFDMISLWDVIEHLPDPVDALTHVRRLLKPGGILLLNYPDIDTWQAKLTGKHFWWILSVHLYHFSPATIAKLCERAGFSVFHTKPYWQSLEFGYLERLAQVYNIPLAGIIHRMTPQRIREILIPFYASQTTALARVIQ